MNGTQNINIDAKTLDACIKTINKIGRNEYHNICTGEVSVIGWGIDNMLEASVAILMVVFTISLIIFILYAVIRTILDR